MISYLTGYPLEVLETLELKPPFVASNQVLVLPSVGLPFEEGSSCNIYVWANCKDLNTVAEISLVFVSG